MNTRPKSAGINPEACSEGSGGGLPLHQLKRFGNRVNRLGVNFAVCNTDGELVLPADGDRKLYARRYAQYAKRCIETNGSVCRFGEHNQVLAAVLKGASEAVGAALIDLGTVYAMTDAGRPDRESIFSEMLALLAEDFQAVARAERQIEMVGTELAQVYEQLVLLHKLSMNMNVARGDADFLQMALDHLTGIVGVEGIAILMENTVEGRKQLVLVAGSGLIDIDQRTAAILHSRLAEEINSGKEALLDSEVDSPLRYDWPDGIKSIIAMPLYGQSGKRYPADEVRIIGLMVAINRVDRPDFDSTDVKLFSSVVNVCAVFIENGRLFNNLEELFIGSLRALTSSIDAKDPYTRGHSERVAFISRWIAERLDDRQPLEAEQIHQIYLAGLLHDVGKIGIDDAVLRKKGKLSKKDLDRIKTHSSIGAGILSQIKQMRDIVPGVLHHHERLDGKGYPDGLAGRQIPLTGKIVALADAFDAMTSKRAYRSAMTVEQALAEIEKRLGTQFDQNVGRVFISSDVYHLWDIMQGGFGGVEADSNSVAVGTLIR